jgi:hypothetical protein
LVCVLVENGVLGLPLWSRSRRLFAAVLRPRRPPSAPVPVPVPVVYDRGVPSSAAPPPPVPVPLVPWPPARPAVVADDGVAALLASALPWRRGVSSAGRTVRGWMSPRAMLVAACDLHNTQTRVSVGARDSACASWAMGVECRSSSSVHSGGGETI